MTTETAPATRVAPELIADRWQRAMVRPRFFANDGGAVSEDNSKAFYRIDRTLDALAGRLAGEVSSDEALRTLEVVKGAIWAEIERSLTDWAKVYAR